MDDTTDVCICPEFSYTEVPAVSAEAHGNGLDISCCVDSAYVLQLVADLEGWVGPGGSSYYT